MVIKARNNAFYRRVLGLPACPRSGGRRWYSPGTKAPLLAKKVHFLRCATACATKNRRRSLRQEGAIWRCARKVAPSWRRLHLLWQHEWKKRLRPHEKKITNAPLTLNFIILSPPGGFPGSGRLWGSMFQLFDIVLQFISY